jgi:hypothetical protein
LGLKHKKLPFDAVQEVSRWQLVAQDDSKKEWDALQEWARSFKAWSLEKKKPDLERTWAARGGHMHAKDTSKDRSAYPYPMFRTHARTHAHTHAPHARTRRLTWAMFPTPTAALALHGGRTDL